MVDRSIRQTFHRSGECLLPFSVIGPIVFADGVCGQRVAEIRIRMAVLDEGLPLLQVEAHDGRHEARDGDDGGQQLWLQRTETVPSTRCCVF